VGAPGKEGGRARARAMARAWARGGIEGRGRGRGRGFSSEAEMLAIWQRAWAWGTAWRSGDIQRRCSRAENRVGNGIASTQMRRQSRRGRLGWALLEAQARVVLCCGWVGRRRLHRRCSRRPLQQRAPGVGLHLRHWLWQCYGAGGMGAGGAGSTSCVGGAGGAVALVAQCQWHWWRGSPAMLEG
jgi:hypothetical protein